MKYKNITCMVCSSDNAELIIDREFPKHYICRQCGFVYMNPVPDFSTNQDYYQKEYWNQHHQMKGLITTYPEITRQARLVRWITPYVQPESKLLEIGCGFGFNLDYIRKYTGLVPEGLEISADGHYNTENAFHIKCHHSTVEAFNPDHSYDIIVMSHVLEHFENPQFALDKAFDFLNKTGVIWIEVPNIMKPNPAKSLGKWLSREHISYFSPEKLKTMLYRAGFNVIREENDFYTCMLAVKTQKPDVPYLVKNEYHQVKNAIRRHDLKYFIYKVLKKFNIHIFSKYRGTLSHK